MASGLKALVTEKFLVGYEHDDQNTILIFEFADKPPLNLLIRRENAEKIANAILANYRNPPPRPAKMN
jgi:hypothetical protein